MRGSSLTEVDLDGRVLPTLPAPDGDEVDGEPSQGAAFLEHLPYPVSGILDLAAVLGVSGERGAEEDLAGRSPQYLVVGGDDTRLSKRVDAALHGRRAHLLPLHPALHDAAHLAELVNVVLPGLAVGLEPRPARQLFPHPARQVRAFRGAVVVEDR